jgi:hypothetical protein
MANPIRYGGDEMAMASGFDAMSATISELTATRAILDELHSKPQRRKKTFRPNSNIIELKIDEIDGIDKKPDTNYAAGFSLY